MIQNLLFTLAQATPPAGGPPSLLSNALPFVAIAIIFYFLIMRPQQKAQKARAALIAGVKTGDKVVMTGGIHGIVANVKDTTILVKVADNVKIEFDRSAVTSVAKASSEV